jgi:serine protease Do
MSNNTLYAALGIEASANSEAIAAAFAARQQALHDKPDELSLLRVAYETLRHPEQRAAYDRKLMQQKQPADTIISEFEIRPRRTLGRRYNALILLVAASATIVFFWFNKPQAKPKPPVRPAATLVATVSAPTAPQSTAAAEAADPAPQQEASAVANNTVPPAAAAATETYSPTLATRGAKQPGFDAQYLAWSVFTIRQRNLSGSGVLIGPDRILTNCHVLAGGATNGLVVINGMSRVVSKVEKYARLDGEDACLLLAPGAGNDGIAWGSSASLQYGDTVHTFGHPGGSSNITWSEGTFHTRVERGGETFLLSDNYCRPGSSGGPLLSNKGLLIGVVTAVQRFQAKGGEPPQYGACVSLTEATAHALLNKPLFPIALAPAQYVPNY